VKAKPRRVSVGFLTALGAAGFCATLWLLGGPGWAALRDHPYFAISDLEISGEGPLLDEQAIRDWLSVHDGASLWDASPARVQERLESHPWIEHARVRREFPNRFEVRVRERVPLAIVVLDDLYYVDRSATMFGPLGPEHSRDYPVITGLRADMPSGSRRWALRRALRLLRRCGRRPCFESLSEIHLDPERGVVVYPGAPAVPVVLGWGSWSEKLERAERTLELWEGSTDRLARIDVRFHNQVVVALRPTPETADRPRGGGPRGS
jgi:cell division protein FtsQ